MSPQRETEFTLVLIKPDGLKKSLTGNILTKLSETRLVIVGAKVVKVSRELAEAHYQHLKDKPFFKDLIEYIQGKPYGPDYQRVMALVYRGPDAIQKVRQLAGATNPEEADSVSIRGAYGRITTKGVFENVIHASANREDAEREIKLWFQPAELSSEAYPTRKQMTRPVEALGWAQTETKKVGKIKITNKAVLKWVEEAAKLCKPDSIYWCNGSAEEKQNLIAGCIQDGELEDLNQEKLPGCYLHRSAQNDVARTEHLTFICTPTKKEAGPTNNWMAPSAAYRKLSKIYDGCMRGRTMYVVPFIMGPAGSPFSKVGIEITDSRYVALNMDIMTRMGDVAWKQLGESEDFTRGLHSKADVKEDKRFICHFPQDNTIWSVGSGYGGNALLGKKCLALRIASALGRQEGWLAEHMLILGVESPDGQVRYITGAFPSACGKTNLAMLIPPLALKGYKVWTVGDDIAWLRIGPDGRLWASNPEAGFFGVVPGTNSKSNPNAVTTIQKNTIYTNVAKRPDGTPWWEGHDDPAPSQAIDWRGEPWTPSSPGKAAHPNSRFTAPANQCPSISPKWQDPAGVPIDAMVFGGRRAHLAPLVYQSFNWQHGVFVGASAASETTSAQQGGAVGVVRRDPMAMLPFCGYNMADYFAHWLAMGKRIPRPPKIFHVNWFRQDQKGQFLWPGFGDNLRVLLWILDRAAGEGDAIETPIGYVPPVDAINRKGLEISREALESLLEVDVKEWEADVKNMDEFFAKFGSRLPKGIREERDNLLSRLKERSSSKKK